MSKRNRKPPKMTTVQELTAAMRRVSREAIVADMREGRVQKAHTFTDRKRQARREACRGKFSPVD